MIELKDQIIMVCDVPNRNGRMYSRQTMTTAIKELQTVPGQLGMPENHLLECADVCLTARNFRIDDVGNVLCDIELHDTESGRNIQESIHSGIGCFRTAGFGKFDIVKVGILEVTNFVLTSVNFVYDGA